MPDPSSTPERGGRQAALAQLYFADLRDVFTSRGVEVTVEDERHLRAIAGFGPEITASIMDLTRRTYDKAVQHGTASGSSVKQGRSRV